jgi:hypothetical protein
MSAIGNGTTEEGGAAMTNDQINAAIAEVCGWTEIGICDCGFKIGGMPPYRSAHKKHIPDYCTDLNEMHHAEDFLRGNELLRYAEMLDSIIGSLNGIRAIARERAEAFLRVLGKWKEVQP